MSVLRDALRTNAVSGQKKKMIGNRIPEKMAMK